MFRTGYNCDGEILGNKEIKYSPFLIPDNNIEGSIFKVSTYQFHSFILTKPFPNTTTTTNNNNNISIYLSNTNHQEENP